MMTYEELYSQFTIQIYQEPLSLIRSSEDIAHLANEIAVLMLVVDFVTEVQMNGILGFLGNSAGLYVQETAEALRIVGCTEDSKRLKRIFSIASGAGMTYAAMQRDMSSLRRYMITSFKKLHGNKWDDASEKIGEIEDNMDLGDIWLHGRNYLKNHIDIFRAVIVE